jgi:hypothetical protein
MKADFIKKVFKGNFRFLRWDRGKGFSGIHGSKTGLPFDFSWIFSVLVRLHKATTHAGQYIAASVRGMPATCTSRLKFF